MVVTLILILLIVIFMACFVGFNLRYVCDFWFFKTYTNLPVSILALIAFAAGIVFALLLIFIAKMKAPPSDAEERAARKLQKKAKAEEKLRQAEARKAAKEAKKNPPIN